MNLMELKNQNKNDVLEMVKAELNNQYVNKYFGQYLCFVSKAGIPFQLFAFPGDNALCIEYAETSEDAELGRFEDGDRFFLEDYGSVGELVAALINEIEASSEYTRREEDL